MERRAQEGLGVREAAASGCTMAFLLEGRAAQLGGSHGKGERVSSGVHVVRACLRTKVYVNDGWVIRAGCSYQMGERCEQGVLWRGAGHYQ